MLPGKCVSRHSTRRPDRSAPARSWRLSRLPACLCQGTGLDCTGGFARPTADWDLDTGCSGTAITELTAAYQGHNLSVDLGPDNPTWAARRFAISDGCGSTNNWDLHGIVRIRAASK